MSGHTALERAAAVRSPEQQLEFERRAVAEHYEHDPRIFQLVLGRHVAYSTGKFERPDEELDAAQDRKLAWIADQLELPAGPARLLDVGCGWGSVSLFMAAAHPQLSVQGLTLSGEQRGWLLAQAAARGLAPRIQVDVRHVGELELEPASLDAVVFVGSVVHMHDRAAVYGLAARALRPGGRLLVSDCFFPATPRGDRESRATQYIFGTALGYCRLIPLHEELGYIERAGFDLVRVEDFTASYVHTTGHWIDNVRRHRARIDELAPGFSRLLQTYLTVGRLSFARRSALEYMVVARRPD